MSSVEPSWAETSVRWLRSNTSITCSPGKSFPLQLIACLRKIGYLAPGHDTFSSGEYLDILNSLVRSWSHGDHTDLVEFVQGSVMHPKAVPFDKKEDLVGAATPNPDKVQNDTDPLDRLTRNNNMSSKASKEPELDEIVSALALQADPRYGRW